MRFFTIVSVLAAATLSLAQDKTPPADLVIDRTHIPEDCSVTADKGDKIEVHYTGTRFTDGGQFDSSVERGTPLPLTLGIGQVIKGWDEGLVGMCVGEKRTLTIPAHKAYGSRGFGDIIPENSALVFTTQLMKLQKAGDSESQQYVGSAHEEL